jgi:hypothetical protein
MLTKDFRAQCNVKSTRSWSTTRGRKRTHARTHDHSTHLPIACVAYPADFKSSGMNVSRPGTPYGQSIRITAGPTPVCDAYLPVINVDRVGLHSGCT